MANARKDAFTAALNRALATVPKKKPKTRKARVKSEMQQALDRALAKIPR